MSARLHCLVPFCRRTCKPGDYGEWICGPHWRLVSTRVKRVYKRARHQLRKWRSAVHAEAVRNGGWVQRSSIDQALAARNRCEWLWARAKREAIERAAGIA
jgi:hypothetical protein